jgi:drug/metabolite transporter (DMT)-like permease
VPLFALFLILLAAFAHSTWNLLAKRAASNEHFIWFSSVCEAALLLPLAVWILADSWPRIGLKAGMFLFATGILHLIYTEALLRGYRVEDLSVVYPIARGTSPLLSFVGAVLLLGEHTSMLSGAGALMVSAGIMVLSADGHVRNKRWAGQSWGAATGLIIASYTMVDGYSVKVLLLSPVLVEYAGNVFRAIVLSAGAWQGRESLLVEHRRCWKEALGVSILTPVSYVLVLFAMRVAPISHVAPAREMSMMIGVYLGTRFLKEGHLARRLTGSGLIVTGVAVLASG